MVRVSVSSGQIRPRFIPYAHSAMGHMRMLVYLEITPVRLDTQNDYHLS